MPSGYTDDLWNRVPCCKECNSSKGARTFFEWYSSSSPMRPRGPRVLSKFVEYEAAFVVRCPRIDTDGPEWRAWWRGTMGCADRFLSTLQRRVDERVRRVCAEQK